MKRKFMTTAIAAAMFTSPLLAQNMNYEAGKTTFGVRAGVNFQNINGKDAAGNNLKNNVATGFHAGVNAEVPIGTGFYLQPGVLYSQKGAESKNSDQQVKLNYIEVPVNLVYKPILGTGRMLLGFGPYAAFGLGGKVKNGGAETKVSFEKTAAGSPNLTGGVYKGFDAGANFIAGYEFARNLSFQVNAQLGLVNINPEFAAASNDQSKWRNTGFGASLGYRF